MPENSRLSTTNYILGNLPEKDFERLLPDLEEVWLEAGQIIYQAEQAIEYVYFPENVAVSIIAHTVEGESCEVGIIGREGIIGTDVLMGVDLTLNENLVQLAGKAFRIKTDILRKEFKRAGAFHDLALHFAHLLTIQISQTTLCNRLHKVEKRLARWLLICHDRADGDKLTLTQEFLSIMLGANRATVTLRAIALQNAGYIKYSRGLISITDRQGLEDFSCACYQIVKKEYDRVQK